MYEWRDFKLIEQEAQLAQSTSVFGVLPVHRQPRRSSLLNSVNEASYPAVHRKEEESSSNQ